MIKGNSSFDVNETHVNDVEHTNYVYKKTYSVLFVTQKNIFDCEC
jgi:hypothetical protein